MTLVVRQNIRGKPIGEPLRLDRRRRRLSTVVARHVDRSRPFIVSVHRLAEPLHPTDDAIKLAGDWKYTLIGSGDVVAVTYLPLGGGGRSAAGGSGGRGGKQIGGAIAMIALAVAAPYAAGLIFGAGTLMAGVASAAIIAGGAYLISKATQAKANKSNDDNRPLYGVSGGGNLPRAGDRIPRGYGHFWTQPDLTQPDYIINEGEDQLLFKRMTLGVGRYSIKTLQIGDAVLWTANGGVQPPFIGAEVEIINPGETSDLVPGTVITAQGVNGAELPRIGGNPDWAGPFPVTPVGVYASRIQLDYGFPQGVYSQFNNSAGNQTGPVAWGVRFEYAICDDDDVPIGGAWAPLHVVQNTSFSTRAMRYTAFVDVDPNYRYVVRARNPNTTAFANPRVTAIVNEVVWEAMRAHLMDSIVRPHVTEIAIKVRSGKTLGVTAFGQVWCEANALIPIWNGSSWSVAQETRDAVWAYADILRGSEGGITYGAGLADSQIDVARLSFYGNTVTEHDTFDGVIRGPVSVYEAGATVLGVMRAEPSRIGNAWSMTRDEPRAARKHVFTRRQIVRDSTTSNFKIGSTDGASDVIVEYYHDGDPRRRREWRTTFGSESLTPRRYNLAGVSSHDHAVHHSTWLAASAYFRRETRRFTSELEGRLVNRNDPALVDAWFMSDARAAGIVSRSGFTLNLDTDVVVGGATYAMFKDRQNRSWGPVKVTAGASASQVILDSADVAVVEAFYSATLASVLADAEDEMTPVLIGPITEFQDPYIIQSAIPQGKDRIAIEAVYDSPEVWTALGEPLPPEPPIPSTGDTAYSPVPTIPWIRASAHQYTTGLVVEWAVGNPRNAALVVVDLSYDNWATSQRISESLSTSGTYPLKHVSDDDPVYMRAYAVSAAGIPGPGVSTSFFTFKPAITSEIAEILVEIEALSEQARKDIASIAALGEGTVRDAIRKVEDKLEELGAVAADEVALTEDQATRSEILAARTEDNTAAIVTEAIARADGDTALAQVTTALTTTVGGHTATLTTLGQSVDGIKVQYGVVGNISGTVGGFVFQGVQKLDGSVQYGMAFDVQTFIITNGATNKTPFGIVQDRVVIPDLIITQSLQLTDNVVITGKIDFSAVSRSAGAVSSGGDVQVSLNCRAGANVLIIGSFDTSGLSSPGTNNFSMSVVDRTGGGNSILKTTELGRYVFVGANNATQTYYMPTTIFFVHTNVPEGIRTYAITSGRTGCSIAVVENAR